ncbi:MAG: serine/threonine-protein phosphatase, partial [Bdellovibrionales bacterium]|nr:serine/threonine-protein phosphatase [Bdellovibrionales bacterium]
AQLPRDPRYELAVIYEPLEGVGGDWYYAQVEANGCLSVQIADVTGHGLSAAFICAMTKLARMAARKEEPHHLLAEMNRLLTPVLPSGRFLTAAAFLYDPESGALRFARAGHPPALVLSRQTGEVKHLQSDGFALGFLDEADYDLSEVSLEVGDLAVLLTDGIPEAQNLKNEMYEMDRVSEVMKSGTENDSGAEFLRRLIKDFDEFRDGRILKDDITVVVLRRVQ